LSRGNSGNKEIFAASRNASEAAEHGDLSDVGERIGDWSLKERLCGGVERLV